MNFKSIMIASVICMLGFESNAFEVHGSGRVPSIVPKNENLRDYYNAYVQLVAIHDLSNGLYRVVYWWKDGHRSFITPSRPDGNYITVRTNN